MAEKQLINLFSNLFGNLSTLFTSWSHSESEFQTLNERDHLNVFNFTAIKQFFNAWSKSSWFKTRTRTSHGTVRVAPPLHQHTQSILILVYFSIQLASSGTALCFDFGRFLKDKPHRIFSFRISTQIFQIFVRTTPFSKMKPTCGFFFSNWTSHRPAIRIAIYQPSSSDHLLDA